MKYERIVSRAQMSLFSERKLFSPNGFYMDNNVVFSLALTFFYFFLLIFPFQYETAR